MWKISVPLLSVVALALGLNQNTEKPDQGRGHGLDVRLSLEKVEFSVGESIPVRVQVSNSGENPLLIGNSISWVDGGSPVSRIEFELRDAQGHVLPRAFALIGDSFSGKKEPNPGAAFLSSYLLLYPGYSLMTRVVVRPSLFKGLDKPGSYKLSAIYSSNGLSYPPTYHEAGLNESDVMSLPFKSWSGKISTNAIRFKVRSLPTGRDQ